MARIMKTAQGARRRISGEHGSASTSSITREKAVNAFADYKAGGSGRTLTRQLSRRNLDDATPSFKLLELESRSGAERDRRNIHSIKDCLRCGSDKTVCAISAATTISLSAQQDPRTTLLIEALCRGEDEQGGLAQTLRRVSASRSCRGATLRIPSVDALRDVSISRCATS